MPTEKWISRFKEKWISRFKENLKRVSTWILVKFSELRHYYPLFCSTWESKIFYPTMGRDKVAVFKVVEDVQFLDTFLHFKLVPTQLSMINTSNLTYSGISGRVLDPENRNLIYIFMMFNKEMEYMQLLLQQVEYPLLSERNWIIHAGLNLLIII